MKDSYLIAVYGSLRRGMHNHKYIEGSRYLGTITKRGWQLYSLGSFPAIKKHWRGRTVFELYEVSHDRLMFVRALEGGYERGEIDTPFGKAEMYYMKARLKSKVDSEDWVLFYKSNGENR